MLPRRSSSVAQAASSLFTAVADGPQAASIGVPALSSPDYDAIRHVVAHMADFSATQKMKASHSIVGFARYDVAA